MTYMYTLKFPSYANTKKEGSLKSFLFHKYSYLHDKIVQLQNSFPKSWITTLYIIIHKVINNSTILQKRQLFSFPMKDIYLRFPMYNSSYFQNILFCKM